MKTCIFNKNFVHREVFNKTDNFQSKFLDIVYLQVCHNLQINVIYTIIFAVSDMRAIYCVN